MMVIGHSVRANGEGKVAAMAKAVSVSPKDLCLRLMRADTQEDVIEALTEAGYWKNGAAWRMFDDSENNYSTIGNQQSRAEAALVEKIVNSIDARLVNACLAAGIEPESDSAPQSIRAAVARFFEKNEKKELGPDAGRVKNWPPSLRTTEARLITVSATGMKPEDHGYACLTIADAGEGQTPSKFPDTFLSLNKSNKLRIPFVQGKFNMGGTGALQFSGANNLQLVVSRRNQALLGKKPSATDRQWGFTVVRREDPVSGSRRNSTYTYLAPEKSVLSFDADTMPIFPEGQNAYGREHAWGTLIKLYEYEMKGFRTNIVLGGGGLMRRLDLLLPEVALPIRLYECRSYKGHSGSYETNVIGVGVRLDDDGQTNLEEGFPASAVISALGEEMRVTIYAFKRGKAEEYRLRQGVIFAINGQTHGHLPNDFFRRTSVGMSYLADSLFVAVDCSGIGGRAREDLFMNSRDRLRENELRSDIEEQLADVIKDNKLLRLLKNKRRQEDIETKINDSKPLAEIIERLIKESPALASLFNFGTRITNPFAPDSAATLDTPFVGKNFPTYFRFKERKYGEILKRDANLNRRPRIVFETDAENSYFSRDVDPGQVEVAFDSNGTWSAITSFSLNLSNGVGNLNCPLPTDAKVDDEFRYRVRVTDHSRVTPFENVFVIRVRPSGAPPVKPTKPGIPPKPPSKEKGNDREKPSMLAMPPITPVKEAEWDKHKFTKFSALKVQNAGAEGDDTPTQTWDFYVNVDNQWLKTEQKRSKTPPQLLEVRFMYALVLIGLALIQEERAKRAPDPTEEEPEPPTEKRESNIEKQILKVTSAIAPILLPMLDLLPGLDEGDEPPPV